jgi:hypothetical protein
MAPTASATTATTLHLRLARREEDQEETTVVEQTDEVEQTGATE